MTHLRVSAGLLLFATMLNAQSFVNFESSQVHPICLSPSGNLLFAVNTPDNRLAVYSLQDPRKPVLLREIPVGLEPVSVAARSDNEVWVVNWLSDSISVVSVAKGIVTATIQVKDEPMDIVFAGTPAKAFVSVGGSKELRVFDANKHNLLKTIPIFGEEPRALSRSADGNRVWLAVHRSGNRSTIVPEELAPLPPKPTNPRLPDAPKQGVIVSSDDPFWRAIIKIDLADLDVWEINATQATVAKTYQKIGTSLFGMAQRPGTQELWVANTQALNLIRFEPNLKGHVVDNRLSRIDTTQAANVTHIDLNPGTNYKLFPNPTALSNALAQPMDIVFSPKGDRIFVAAFGTDRIGVLDAQGKILSRIEVGNTPGTKIDTRNKRGPRGLAHHRSLDILYCFNRLSNNLVVLDTQKLAVIRQVKPLHDPAPKSLREGRRFLYDAKLSGNGTMSCATCHIDADIDGLAWDLGNPAGDMTTVRDPRTNKRLKMHPMKGPMTTQTLKGLKGLAPFHWRGDKAKLEDFNPAFASLLGGKILASTDMGASRASWNRSPSPPIPSRISTVRYARSLWGKAPRMASPSS